MLLASEDRLPENNDMIGESRPIKELIQIIGRISQYDFPVLIHGESGTGKELVAKAIHQYSPRGKKPFQALNCAALSDSLMESELFGYVGGAFTGAHKNGSPSLFEMADAGSLFLDEVADLSANAQAALLRVLEEQEVVRVGGRHTIPVNVRVITASNRSLEKLVGQEEFRQDLYHRLCVIPVKVPPLRERYQDIPLLMKHFLAQLSDSRYPGPEVLEYLYKYHWPGNVRELEHCVDYMVAVTEGNFTIDSLPPSIRAHVDLGNQRPVASESDSTGNKPWPARDASLINELHQEHIFILNAINRANCKGNGIGRRTLAQLSRQQGFYLTEGSIRSRLYTLRVKGLVQWGSGRTGVRLTPKGQIIIQNINTHLN